jgi:alanyl-tRNA synthetase
VKLDQTVFYAFSGGQLSDEGTIGSIKVLKAEKQGDKEDIIDIEYTLEKEPDFNVGDTVDVKIDPKRRETLRKLHSAAHIVYYFVIEKLGKVKINGSEIQPDKARMDFGYVVEKIPEMKKAVNEFIVQGYDIIMKPGPVKPDLRWWTCNEWKMPCGGTHVKNTKEIALLKLVRKNKGKGRERIEIHLTQ